MSLVGPRPCMESQRSFYGDAWTQYTAVRPGLTGLWQVSGRNNLTFAQRVALDKEYVTCCSLWLDGKIILNDLAPVFQDTVYSQYGACST
jgi:exopolysaccharide production protein ExoY